MGESLDQLLDNREFKLVLPGVGEECFRGRLQEILHDWGDFDCQKPPDFLV
jgi:hypothetical protein